MILGYLTSALSTVGIWHLTVPANVSFFRAAFGRSQKLSNMAFCFAAGGRLVARGTLWPWRTRPSFQVQTRPRPDGADPYSRHRYHHDTGRWCRPQCRQRRHQHLSSSVVFGHPESPLYEAIYRHLRRKVLVQYGDIWCVWDRIPCLPSRAKLVG